MLTMCSYNNVKKTIEYTSFKARVKLSAMCEYPPRITFSLRVADELYSSVTKQLVSMLICEEIFEGVIADLICFIQNSDRGVFVFADILFLVLYIYKMVSPTVEVMRRTCKKQSLPNNFSHKTIVSMLIIA